MTHREIWPTLKRELDRKEVLVITGPRQVGKTTTLKWLLEQIPENKVYLDLTLASVQRLFDYEDYDNIITQLKGFGVDFAKRPVLAIDEIQYSKHIPRVIKYLYDHYDIKFILSGSSAFYLKNQFSESLSARKIIYEMLPLTFREFLAIKSVKYTPASVDFSTLSDGSRGRSPSTITFDAFAHETLAALYDEYIEFGGFPGVALSESTDRKRQMLDVIFSSYINMDVTQLADFKSVSDLRKLIALLAVRVGSRINVDELSKVMGLSRQTVMNHIAFLEQTYLIRLLPAFSKSVSVRERIPKKVFFVDTGIANINADLSSGAQFENTLCHQLQAYGKTSFSSAGGEIDFILTRNKKNIALEAKETPVDNHLNELTRRATKIHANACALIGRNPSAHFTHFIWGGTL